MRTDGDDGSGRLMLTQVEAFIASVVANSPGNRLLQIDDSPIFDAPLIGVADGYDPLFEQYRSIIGPHHLRPRDVISITADTPPQALRVLCWVLPITAETRHSNAAEKRHPSERWAHTYHYGEAFNNELRASVERLLQAHGARAAAPVLLPSFQTVRGPSNIPSSTWSERHALFAAGLGTFGLCDGFLTPVGKAMRCGSVVTDLPLPVTERRYATHTAACTYLTQGRCGACIARCPAGAIGPSGHDKNACERYQQEQLKPMREKYGTPITGCGLCQVGVPCESSLP